MIRILALLGCLALPVLAQDAPVPPAPAPGGVDDALGLMEQGARSFLRGLADQIGPGMTEMQRSFDGMKPALEDMGEALAGLRPMAEQLLSLVDNMGNYLPPELMPNGDILIRRKPAQRPQIGPPKAGETDL